MYSHSTFTWTKFQARNFFVQVSISVSNHKVEDRKKSNQPEAIGMLVAPTSLRKRTQSATLFGYTQTAPTVIPASSRGNASSLNGKPLKDTRGTDSNWQNFYSLVRVKAVHVTSPLLSIDMAFNRSFLMGCLALWHKRCTLVSVSAPVRVVRSMHVTALNNQAACKSKSSRDLETSGTMPRLKASNLPPHSTEQDYVHDAHFLLEPG